MNVKCIVFCLSICFLFLSCDFNINNRPGPQMSMSVKEAQSNGTFICEYGIVGNTINGIHINTIFAEKKFWRNEGVLLKKQINCCESQLIIVSAQHFSNDGTGYDFDWNLQGFEGLGNYLIYKDFMSISLPDSIPITVVAINGKDSTRVIEKLTLYKIHEEK